MHVNLGELSPYLLDPISKKFTFVFHIERE